MQVGDLVQMRIGYSAPGVIIEVTNLSKENSIFPSYAKVMWSDDGLGLEKIKDLVVVSSTKLKNKP